MKFSNVQGNRYTVHKVTRHMDKADIPTAKTEKGLCTLIMGICRRYAMSLSMKLLAAPESMKAER